MSRWASGSPRAGSTRGASAGPCAGLRGRRRSLQRRTWWTTALLVCGAAARHPFGLLGSGFGGRCLDPGGVLPGDSGRSAVRRRPAHGRRRSAGLLAALAVAFYPPLVTMTADLLSEPVGTLALAVAVLAFVWALRGASVRRYAAAGLLIGVATLVRADFLLLPLVLALLVRRRGPVIALLAAAALVVVPWSAYISARAGHLTAVTTGDAPVLFIGTCLPCDGTLLGLKQTYGDEARRRDRALRRVPDTRLPASAVLDAVAARRPGQQPRGGAAGRVAEQHRLRRAPPVRLCGHGGAQAAPALAAAQPHRHERAARKRSRWCTCWWSCSPSPG